MAGFIAVGGMLLMLAAMSGLMAVLHYNDSRADRSRGAQGWVVDMAGAVVFGSVSVGGLALIVVLAVQA